jgi:hypothetical protein
MMIQVVRNEVLANGARSIELATEKKAIEIYHGTSFSSVCVKNGSHAAYRGASRVFHGANRLAEALASYKDSHVKAMLETAVELSN